MKLFVAVEVGPQVADAARRLVDELRARVVRLAPASRVTWVAVSRLHLTIRFIGQVDEAVAADVQVALRPPFASPAFALSLAGVGTFPERGSPRVVWVGAGSGVAPLLALGDEVDARLAVLRVPRRDGPLRPHVTVGRVRRPAGLRSARLVDGLEAVVLGTVPVEAVTLFESRTPPAGPAYVPLLRMPLAGPHAGGLQS